jgi:MFS family permease
MRMAGFLQRWIVLKSRGFGALACRDFRLFAFGNSLSLIGMWVQRVGAGWLVWEISHSSLWLGLLALADLFPTVFLAPIAGLMADRCDPRRVMLYCQCVAMAMAVLQACLILGDASSMEWLLVVTLVTGIAGALCQPTRLSWTSTLVPQQQLGSAVALTSLCFSLARFAGPAVAGALLLKLDPSALFFVPSSLPPLFAFRRARVCLPICRPRIGDAMPRTDFATSRQTPRCGQLS